MRVALRYSDVSLSHSTRGQRCRQGGCFSGSVARLFTLERLWVGVMWANRNPKNDPPNPAIAKDVTATRQCSGMGADLASHDLSIAWC